MVSTFQFLVVDVRFNKPKQAAYPGRMLLPKLKKKLPWRDALTVSSKPPIAESSSPICPRRRQTDVVCFDRTIDFEEVKNRLLLSKLFIYGLSTKYNSWFDSCNSNRGNSVQVSVRSSAHFIVSYVVP